MPKQYLSKFLCFHELLKQFYVDNTLLHYNLNLIDEDQ